jgi:effector-binding domain-containing protein
MNHQPRIEQRDAIGYVAIPLSVTINGLASAVDQTFPELFGWLASHSIAPAGAPFIRYLTVDMDAEMDIELAAPVTGQVPADGRVRAGVLPPGRYLTLLHVGHYDQLVQANATVQSWADAHGLRWAMDEGSRWRGRLERYLTDPSLQPDPSQWQTELAYLIDDQTPPAT